MRIKSIFSQILVGISFALLPWLVYADPTEIFFTSEAESTDTNILFILDNSGSMLSPVAGSGGKTRMKVMQESFSNVIAGAASSLNVGLMRYGGDFIPDRANGMVFPISPINSKANDIVGAFKTLDNLPDPDADISVRDYLPVVANSWVEGGGTPMVNALYEAALYFRGQSPDQGFLPPDGVRAAHPASYNGAITSCTANMVSACLNERGGCPVDNGGCFDVDYLGLGVRSFCYTSPCVGGEGFATYKSPIKSACQANYMVLMTDGEPSVNTVQDKVRDNIFQGQLGCNASSLDFDGAGECGPELTHYLKDNDQSTTLSGKQSIDTFVIGFGVGDVTGGEDYLRRLVSSSENYYSANTQDDLVKAFSTILAQIKETTNSFSAPSYSLSSENALANGSDIYMPVIKVANGPLWSGNLRKFQLKNGHVVSSNAEAATDASGNLQANAKDFWSQTASGADVEKGGATALLVSNQRHLYTDAIGTTLSALRTENNALTGYLLRPNLQAAGTTNGEIAGVCTATVTDDQPNCITLTYRNKLINFARGVNEDGSERHHMGDTLNSKPLVFDYKTNGLTVGSTVFLATNEGYLHAFNAASGQERWAFMPAKLLKNIDTFYQNTGYRQHVYGIDGQLTIWNDTVNEKVYLIFGLGRGGSAYYALDVTDPDQPQLAWKIDETKSGFAELGETWSKPTLSRLRLENSTTPKTVLVFGAGYDANKDEENILKRKPDSHGRDVYIVDAATGSLIWSLARDAKRAASTKLLDSIPGDIRVLDMDGNKVLDRLYFADTGGNVWRVDMDMDARDTDSTLYDYTDAQLTPLAKLGNTGYGKLPRMFFFEPDTALMSVKGKLVLTVSIGSGYRMHPLNRSIQDNFYVLRDDYVMQPRPLLVAPLLQDTDVINYQQLNGHSLLDSNAKGWYMPLALHGEKVLASSITFMNKVMFTTFAMADAQGAPFDYEGTCQLPTTTARAYVLDLLSGAAVADLNRDGKGNDSAVVMGTGVILDTPQIIFNTPTAEDGSICKVGDCAQTVDVRVGASSIPLLDKTNTTNDSTSSSVDMSNVMPRLFWLDEAVTKGN